MKDLINRCAGSLCWRCANAYGRCAWSREGNEVKGWSAVRRDLPPPFKNGKPLKSFFVLSCPEFSPDKRFSVREVGGR